MYLKKLVSKQLHALCNIYVALRYFNAPGKI